MNKILTIGFTKNHRDSFAEKIKDKLGLPLYNLEEIYQRGDGTYLKKDEFTVEINKLLENEKWIINGNYERYITDVIKDADAIFFFDLPMEEHLKWLSAKNKSNDVDGYKGEIIDEAILSCMTEFVKNKQKLIKKLINENFSGDALVMFESVADIYNYWKNEGKGE